MSASIPRFLRNVAILTSLVSTLSSHASTASDVVHSSSQISLHSGPFQKETNLSDTSILLLIDLFGQEELHKENSPLRLKFVVIYQTLVAYGVDDKTITRILDMLVKSFVDTYATLSPQQKADRRDEIIASLDEFAIEFILYVYGEWRHILDDVTPIQPMHTNFIGSSVDDILSVLTSLDAVTRQISEEKRKSVEPFLLTKQDNDRLLDAHFVDRPAVQLYLRYHSAISQFPNKDIVNSLRKKKNIDEEAVSDITVIENRDIVSMAIREQMKIRGNSRLDLELLEQVKKFHYQSFLQFADVDRSDINDFLIKIFHTLQRTFPRYERKLTKKSEKNKRDFFAIPKDVQTIAAMMCYAVTYKKLPTYEETVVLLKDIQQWLNELWQLRDAAEELYFHNQELARQDIVSTLKDQQTQLVSVMVDNLVHTIEHPKGWFDVQYVLTASPTQWVDLPLCRQNSCVTIRNMVKAGGVDKPIVYLWPADFGKIDDVIASGSMPVLRWDIIDVLNTMKKHKLGELLTADSPKLLFEQFKKNLSTLAVKYNNNIFEIYFNTSWNVTKIDPNTWKKYKRWFKKAHVAHVVLGPDGELQVFDPHYNPAKWLSKRKWFSVDVFISKAIDRIYKPKGQEGYELLINTSAQYGYLSEDVVSTLAHGSQLLHNPEVRDMFVAKHVWLTPEDLEQYQNFIPDGLTYDVATFSDPNFDDLEKAFPHAAYELLESIFLELEEISNPFVKETILKYLRAWDVRWLQLEFNPDGEPTGILDDSILELIREESYNNLNEKKYKWTVGVDMWYTSP